MDKNLYRIAAAINQAEMLYDESNKMTTDDTLSMIYTTLQIMKDALNSFLAELPEENDHVAGFRCDKE